ncbi:EAL domain-containing protein [Lichenicoccus roseus]|nr:EAL domain-containing protein [Lichenicoccus roseus]
MDQPYFIAIGASGSEGLDDIQRLLTLLSRGTRAVVMIVWHRPSDRVSHLRDILASSSRMPVIVASEASILETGNCYIGEPDGHLTLMDRNRAHLVVGSKGMLQNRSIDALFSSLADWVGPRTIGIVLSGLLDDGSRGLAAIHRAGGLTVVLDPGLKVRGMQQNAIDFDGPISFIGTAGQIAEVVNQLTRQEGDLLPAAYALITTDDTGQIVGWNAGASALFGWQSSDVRGRSYLSLFEPSEPDGSSLEGEIANIPRYPVFNGAQWCLRNDGSRFWADSFLLSKDADGLSGLVIILRNPGLPQPTTPSSISSEPQFQLLTETIPQLVWRSLDDGRWDWASPQWVAYTGQREVESHDRGWREIVHPDDREVTLQAWHVAASRGGMEVEHRLRRADGIYRWFQTRATPLQESEDSSPRQWFGTSTDIDSLRQAEEQVHFLAYHDVLTGVANRAMLDRVLEQTTSAGGQEPAWCNVLYLDLDRFKAINDQFGHRGGDDLLRQVAARIGACVREGDLLARPGGDEFVLVQRVGPPEAGTVLGAKIMNELSRPFAIQGQDLTVKASIGIASCIRDGNTSEELLFRADLALYQAKAAGGGCIKLYDPELEADLRYRQALERDLRLAIENSELDLDFQPIVDIATRETVGYEALARWTHPIHGEVAPGIFIPIAEETGLIVGLGALILELACAAAITWRRQQIVSVNLSPAQLRRHDLVEQVVTVLARTGLVPTRLELEVTEGLLMDDSEQVRNTLQTIRLLGIHVALDDFGTGYAGLGYLCQFPFDKLKIDQSFTRKMETDTGSYAVVKAVVALGQSLGLQVIAEGVETEAQAAMLLAIGCLQGQGYLFGRPVSAFEVPS